MINYWGGGSEYLGSVVMFKIINIKVTYGS